MTSSWNEDLGFAVPASSEGGWWRLAALSPKGLGPAYPTSSRSRGMRTGFQKLELYKEVLSFTHRTLKGIGVEHVLWNDVPLDSCPRRAEARFLHTAESNAKSFSLDYAFSGCERGIVCLNAAPSPKEQKGAGLAEGSFLNV